MSQSIVETIKQFEGLLGNRRLIDAQLEDLRTIIAGSMLRHKVGETVLVNIGVDHETGARMNRDCIIYAFGYDDTGNDRYAYYLCHELNTTEEMAMDIMVDPSEIIYPQEETQ